ncbi:craniofacial development protein 2-like [Mizuhopecten yessoensis]|uniref:craniofacial development protein 2-like n=1 Tax=Mizuhopecten yessoensis TaxID=6573 RepID=UPI000B45780B|nr:craniofacial development protein 2-like [Mizuhopecten yessoensis]
MEKTAKHDLIVVMGDLNATVGNEGTEDDRARGKHGCGSMNNGERLVAFSNMNDLVIGGTLSPHRLIHKLTWCSPNGRDKNQIDHLMFSGTWRRSLMDVKVRRGADVGSDHLLVAASIKLKLRGTGPKPKGHRSFDVDRLKDAGLRTEFTLQLRNRFLALENHDEPMEGEQDELLNNRWDMITLVYRQSSEKCISYRKKKIKDRMTHETWKAIESRRGIKKKVMGAKSERLKERYLEEYREAPRIVKSLVRADKGKSLDDMASKAEEAGARNE